MEKDFVLLICLLSNKSAIGDGFLDLVCGMPKCARSNCIVVKTNAYPRELFPEDVGGFIDIKLSRHDVSFYSLMNFFSTIIQLSKLSSCGRIFVYGVSPLNHIVALLLPSHLRTIWIHDPDLHPGAKLVEKFAWCLIKLMCMISKNVRVLVASSYLVERTKLNFRLPDAKITAIPFPYLRSIVEEGATETQTLSLSEVPQVLFFGRVEPYKGVDVLVRIVHSLFDEGLNFSLRISGKGEFVNMGQHANIRHDNYYVPDSELQSIIKNSTVCVFPYTSATGTQALQSALSLGVPCIVTDIPAFRCIAQQVLNEGVFFACSESALKNLLEDFIVGRVCVDRDRIRIVARIAFSPIKFSDIVTKVI